MKHTSVAKKAISVIVAMGMIISMFACMTGLSVFAVDNTPAPAAAVVKAPVIVQPVCFV